MKPNELVMKWFGQSLQVNLKFWSERKGRFFGADLIFDTGATVSVISEDVLIALGYDVAAGGTKKITTASGPEFVKEVVLDKIMLGNHEMCNVKVYAYEFPYEMYTSGVIGLDIISTFDIHLLFSQGLIKLHTGGNNEIT
ncbi:MAG: retroviral-like aspartic protease family protein [Clostridiales bacterium]|jgi:predicted aspartyl protease|nr:retroviral-like aspartic protease family protein [Clostridiales bacterium]